MTIEQLINELVKIMKKTGPNIEVCPACDGCYGSLEKIEVTDERIYLADEDRKTRAIASL